MADLVTRAFKASAIVPGLQHLLLWLFNTHFIVGCTGVILDDAGRALLFHHTYRTKTAWGTPGGWMRRGESPRDALAREVREESGFKIEVFGPLAVETDPGSVRMEIIYAARHVGGVFRASGEIDEARWFAPGDALPDQMKPLQRRAIEAAFAMRSDNRWPGVRDV